MSVFESKKLSVVLYPKSAENEFGYVTIARRDMKLNDYSHGVVVLPGDAQVGDGSNDALKKMVSHAMFYVNDDTPSLFGYAGVSDIVYVMVQTTRASSFRTGEIMHGKVELGNRFRMNAKPSLLTISRGGYGALQWIDTEFRAGIFGKMVFLAPGGNGGVGDLFPNAVVSSGVECFFVHAVNDEVADVSQSIIMDREIKNRGGKCELVLYEKGGHDVITRPLNAWYPWPMVNDGNYRVTKDSFVPNESIYSFMKRSNPVVNDKLLYVQGIWQREDGSVYAREYNGVGGEKF